MKTKLIFTIITFLSLPFNDFLFSSEDVNVDRNDYLINVEPLRFQMFNDLLTKNTVSTVDVISPNFEDMVGFQFAFNIMQSDFVTITSNVLNTVEIGHYWKEDEGTLAVSWVSGNSQPVSMPAGEILFSIQIISERDILVKDVFSLNEETVPSEAIPNSLEESSILLEFNFLERTTSTDESIDLTGFKLTPNQIKVGKSNLHVKGIDCINAVLYDFNGQLIENITSLEKNEVTVNINKSGLYVIKLYNGIKYYTEILTVYD